MIPKSKTSKKMDICTETYIEERPCEDRAEKQETGLGGDLRASRRNPSGLLNCETIPIISSFRSAVTPCRSLGNLMHRASHAALLLAGMSGPLSWDGVKSFGSSMIFDTMICTKQEKASTHIEVPQLYAVLASHPASVGGGQEASVPQALDLRSCAFWTWT